MVKKESMENRLRRLEKIVHENNKEKAVLKGTDNPITNFFLTLVIGWAPLLVCIFSAVYRYFRVMFFMSRKEQAKRKWAYIKKDFNALYYIAGELKE